MSLSAGTLLGPYDVTVKVRIKGLSLAVQNSWTRLAARTP
jgi:hypothetical protein